MDEWLDLHGEDGDFIPFRPSRTAKWCNFCQCWVERSDMKRWSPDGSFTHFLCSGCDYEFDGLIENNDDYNRDDYHHSQHMEP